MSTTGVREETLLHIGKRVASAPPNAENFEIHRGLQVRERPERRSSYP